MILKRDECDICHKHSYWRIEIPFFKWKIGICQVPPRIDTEKHPFKALIVDRDTVATMTDTLNRWKKNVYGLKEDPPKYSKEEF